MAKPACGVAPNLMDYLMVQIPTPPGTAPAGKAPLDQLAAIVAGPAGTMNNGGNPEPRVKRTALLVDDSAFARRHTRALMEDLGFEVSEAASGFAALEHCRRGAPDLVLLDLVMAGMNGIETLGELQRLCPGLNIIVVSADLHATTQQAVRTAGAVAFISKPITSLALSCTIDRVLNQCATKLPATLEGALLELMTIGYDRAGGALSTMTNERVSLDAAQLTFLPIEEVATRLRQNVGPDVVAVNQVFDGPIGGNAMLILDRHAAMLLTELVDGTEGSQDFNRARQDTITEVGNVLLNSCLGVFGNMLRVKVSFAVPRLQMEDVFQLFDSVVTGSELNHAVVVQSRFMLRASKVSGFFLLVLGISSLDAVVQELKRHEAPAT